jgi:hypothetical protein
VREFAHVLLLAAVFVLLAVVAGKKLTPLRGLPLAALAVVAAAAFAGVYARTQFLRQMLRFASVGPLLFVALFVLASPAGVVFRHNVTAPVRAVQVGVTSVKHPPIVLIFFDEFPLISLMDGRGGIDARRYPNFAELAKGSTWYRNATSVSAYTPYAVPAMLNGRYPHKAVAPFYAEYPNNMFTLFGGIYDLKVQESVTLLCPPRDCSTAAQPEPPGGSARTVLKASAGLLKTIVSPNDSREDPTAGFREPTAKERLAADESPVRSAPKATGFRMSDAIHQNQPARFTSFLQGLQPSATPTLHFVHMLLPHTPYRYLPSGVRYDPAPSQFITYRVGRERYDAQLAYTDALIGDAIGALRKSGLYNDALVIVTADHGVTFTPGFGKRDYKGSAADILWVPLFVKEPGQKTGRVDDRNWEQADLFPTIADYAGIKVPWRMDGISEVRQRRERQEKWFYPSPGAHLGQRVVVDGPANFAEVLRGWQPVAPVLPELVGKRVGELPVRGGGPVAQVQDLDRFQNVQPTGGSVPALVYGLVPPGLPDDSRIAIAVNGRIGTVATTARQGVNQHWFAGFIDNEKLFVPGANRLELFLVDTGDHSLRRLTLKGLHL